MQFLLYLYLNSKVFIYFDLVRDIGIPGGASGKEPTCQCGRHQNHMFDPWVMIPWKRARQPTAVFLPGESHGQRSLEATVQRSQRVGHD